MDKQKQIEEMIKDMCEEYGKECNECPCSGTCANEQLAYDLYEKGYCKIPKLGVVLPFDHYDNLLKTDSQIRKETAEKFAERAKEEAFVEFMGEPIIRASKIDEICKEITEGKV